MSHVFNTLSLIQMLNSVKFFNVFQNCPIITSSDYTVFHVK